jgi:hypothetical protein
MTSFIIECRYCKTGVKITPSDFSITREDVCDRLPECDICNSCRRGRALHPLWFDKMYELNAHYPISILSE